MDASASPNVESDLNKVCNFFLKIEESNFPLNIKQRNTVIKYTKLPDFDFDTRVSWPQDSYTLQPRLCRIIEIDDPNLKTTRSLNPSLDLSTPMTINCTKRKIVTITEGDENDNHPKLSLEIKKSSTTGRASQVSETDFKEKKHTIQKNISRQTTPKNLREHRQSAKINYDDKKQEINSINSSKMNNKRKEFNLSKTKHLSVSNQTLPDNIRSRSIKEKEIIKNMRSSNALSKISVSKNVSTTSESEQEIHLFKNKFSENVKSIALPRKSLEKPQLSKAPLQQNKSRESFLKEIKNRNKPVTIIHVPLDDKYLNKPETEMSRRTLRSSKELSKKVESNRKANKTFKDVNIGTDPLPITLDQVTEIDRFTFVEDSNVQTEKLKESFDNLDIPNVTLIKEKQDMYQKDTVNFSSKSLSNLQSPPLKISSQEHEKKSCGRNLSQSTSYIIGHATLTYTTRQKINFHVVGNNKETCNVSPNPLAYPISVVSVFKKEMKNRELNNVCEGDNTFKKKDKTNTEHADNLNGLNSLNCSYVLNGNKLVKPSDIISTITVNNGLLHSDHVCEQFQRELNFIDSFFESLQYLESCSLSNKCFENNKQENWVSNTKFDVKNSEYGSFLSKFENGANIDYTETMASKSLCLLNLLIRDEQRRAKNLLFVLKMREDALKDFTKSQILWLENKKKQENTDISTLKKKQRGALLKLQHECGEMQRMRKALLTLSEKRKAALMKTKKNIELKLKNNVDVEQIILGKKKLKRNTASDRNIAPLKCFDLSSSGCEESTTSRAKSETALRVPEVSTAVSSVTSAEKCIQTGDSILEAILVDQTTNTAAENFVVVDGSYLNILFHNLSLPQIFSSGKQYEVNEEALKNIVNSANTHYNNLSESDVFEKFMDQIKNRDLDRSSTPSTARSLVEEFDQYYRGLIDEEKSITDSAEREFISPNTVNEAKNIIVQECEINTEKCDSGNIQSTGTMTSNSSTVLNKNDILSTDQMCSCKISLVSVETQSMKGRESATTACQTGPLPVPAGATAVMETSNTEAPIWLPQKSSTSSLDSSSVSSQLLYPSPSSLSSLASPVHCEAEELRRQQLAIEREIKALEQQQCQLLVVREIPDKPPPPYTPPTEVRVPKPPRMFIVDDATEEKINQHITKPTETSVDHTDAFDVFLKDFYEETLGRQETEQSDKPWDACNLLPQKSEMDTEKLIKRTTTDLKEVLAGVTPSAVSGVGARRSDHIDDILFAEWRRCEPEWTTLHTDEAIVKSQVFESIFQKILSQTVDEYKKTVLCINNG